MMSTANSKELLFQSTRPRGRTRRNTYFVGSLRPVSIHASSREDATMWMR